MSTIHFEETTTVTPEQFLAALTDFGPGRSEIWGIALTINSRCTTKAPTPLTSRKDRAACGNGFP